MADEKKLTNEQLDEVAGGIGGSVVQAGVAGAQVVQDFSLNVETTMIQDNSSNPWIDDITVADQYHEGDNIQQNNVGTPGKMEV